MGSLGGQEHARPIAIVGALPIEVAGARRAIRSRKEFAWGEARAWAGIAEVLPAPRTAVAAALGIGRKAVETGLERLVAEFPPAAVAMVGFAGGCDALAGAGAIVACDPMVVEPERGPNDIPIEGRDPRRAHPDVLEAILRAAGECNARIRVAPSVTVNVVAATAAAKDSLGRNRLAAVCDMENFWAARFCAERGVPFGAVRVVFDQVDERLPEIALPGADVRALLWRPRVLASVPRLALRFLRVRSALNGIAGALVRTLATGAPS